MMVAGIVQARMDSTRLPGKVLAPIAGEPMLGLVVSRARRATRLDDVIVATTDRPVDYPIVHLCHERAWACFRGSAADVLDRYYRAAVSFGVETVVRVTSDCPLIDPSVIDQVVAKLVDGADFDYVSNTLPPRTFPRGLDVEAFTFKALERAWAKDSNAAWREHVTPYICGHPELFRLGRISAPRDLSSFRWTVDEEPDLELVRLIYDEIGIDASWLDILRAVEARPQWAAINSNIVQKEIE